jgi:hypothetical protein
VTCEYLYFVKHAAQSANWPIWRVLTQVDGIKGWNGSAPGRLTGINSQRGYLMLKIATLAGTIALALTTSSFAQTTTGPSGQTTTTNPGMATGDANRSSTTNGTMAPTTMAPGSATTGSANGMTGGPKGTPTPQTGTGPSGSMTR